MNSKSNVEVASKELCEELGKLSGWTTGIVYTTSNGQDDGRWVVVDIDQKYGSGPAFFAYTAGYLLRKLPLELEHNGEPVFPILEVCNHDGYVWTMDYSNINDTYMFGEDNPDSTHGDTPEDAACKLSIELFKKGILKKEAYATR